MSLAIIAIIVQPPERDIFKTFNVLMLPLRLVFILKNLSLQTLKKKKINYPKQYLYLLIIHVIYFNNNNLIKNSALFFIIISIVSFNIYNC